MMIDKNTVEQARNADVIDFLEKRYGFTFVHRNSAFRCHQHESLAIKDDRRSWYWHSKGIGGYGALDFLIIGECMPFREAMTELTGVFPAAAPPPPPRSEAEKEKTLVLPAQASTLMQIYDYLCNKRGIDSDIVYSLIRKKMLYEDKRGNVVFVGYDRQGKARFASMRGTHDESPFRGDCAGSDKRFGFYMSGLAPSGRLYIFESAIDAMSHASIKNAASSEARAWERDSRLSLSGTSDTALNFFLNQYKDFTKLIFCLDNDLPGHEAAATMAREYANRGYMVLNKPPHGKDYNEDLQALKKQIQEFNNTLQQNVVI